MPQPGSEYLQHILEEIEYLIQNSRDLDKDAFLSNETLKRAFARSIEIIGEAAKQSIFDARALSQRRMASNRRHAG